MAFTYSCCGLLLVVGEGFHLAIGPLGRKTKVDGYVGAESRKIVISWTKDLRNWREITG